MSLRPQIPDFIVHYSRSEPFRSVTQNPSAQWSDIVQQLTSKKSWGIQRFADPEYLKRRLAVEKQMHSEFIAKGGVPELNNPIYFFLGRHKGFEEHSANVGYAISLANVARSVISFTYGDSMLAFDQDYRIQSGEKYQNSLCGNLYCLDELAALFEHLQFPSTESLAIEAQLWDVPTPEHVKIIER